MQGSLKELYVTQRNDRFEEQWREPSDPRISSYFESMGVSLPGGSKGRGESPGPGLDRDSGTMPETGFCPHDRLRFPAEELYAPYRQDGTLPCFHQHQISDNPYERWGEQDITAHVNFTALIRKGEEVGLKLTGFVPQYRFPFRVGIPRGNGDPGEEPLGARTTEVAAIPQASHRA